MLFESVQIELIKDVHATLIFNNNFRKSLNVGDLYSIVVEYDFDIEDDICVMGIVLAIHPVRDVCFVLLDNPIQLEEYSFEYLYEHARRISE